MNTKKIRGIADANSMQTFGLLHSFHIVLFGIFFFMCSECNTHSRYIECNFDSLIKCVPMKWDVGEAM
jgi:hypothetical protein